MPLLLRILVIISILYLTTAGDGKCRALVLSATTDRGSYHAGALAGLLQNVTSASDFAYDVVTGVSIGALNAAVISQYATGQEQQASDALNHMWTTLTREQIYSYWAGGYVEGLLFKTSLVDSSPFREYLVQNIKTPFQRKIVIGASNANTGNFDTFNETNLLNSNDAAEAILSSSALPLYFPYVNWRQETYLDGSLIMGANFADAVERCLEIVSNKSDIIIDLISTHGGHLDPVQAQDYNTIEVLVRFLEIYLHGWENFEYYLARLDFPEITFRYFIKPNQSLPGSFNPLSFDASNIAADIAMGKQDALAAVSSYGKFGNAPQLIEKALDWLDQNIGVFSHARDTIKDLNKQQNERVAKSNN